MCVLAAVGCTQQSQYQEPEPPTVPVSRPLVQSVAEFLEETGTTEAVQRVEIRARVTGFLEQINFEPGDEVQQEDVLYLIEQRPFVAAVKSGEALLEARKVALKQAETEYERERALVAQKATADRDVVMRRAERDEAIAAVSAAEASLDQAELELEYTEVTSPISGRVGKTLVKLGNLVDKAEATHLTTVVSYDPIYANFSISERALLRFREQREPGSGQIDKDQVDIFLARANDTGFPFRGKLDYWDLAVDESTGTYAVRAVFPNQAKDLVPGLFVRIRLPLGVKENALLVPESALAGDQQGRYLRGVNSENLVERRNVTVGAKFGEMVVIEEGLQADEQVAIRALHQARVGREVKPKLEELAPVEDEMISILGEYRSQQPQPEGIQPPRVEGPQSLEPAEPTQPAAAEPLQPTEAAPRQPSIAVPPQRPAAVPPADEPTF